MKIGANQQPAQDAALTFCWHVESHWRGTCEADRSAKV